MRVHAGWSRWGRGAAVLALAVVIGVTAHAPIGDAQDRTVVIRVLTESADFRARVRAALALGASSDPQMVAPLSRALADPHPAVRAAAASGLGRLGGAEATSALRRATTDTSPEVRDAAERALRSMTSSSSSSSSSSSATSRHSVVEVIPPSREIDWSHVHYVVTLGALENRSSFAHDRLVQMLRSDVQRQLLVLRGVAVLRDGEAHPEADREIARRHIPNMRLEGSIQDVSREVRRGDLSVRCQVSLVLTDEPGHNIRAALSGAATSSARAETARTPQEQRLAEQALEGAVRAAMSGAARAITSAATH